MSGIETRRVASRAAIVDAESVAVSVRRADSAMRGRGRIGGCRGFVEVKLGFGSATWVREQKGSSTGNEALSWAGRGGWRRGLGGTQDGADGVGVAGERPDGVDRRLDWWVEGGRSLETMVE